MPFFPGPPSSYVSLVVVLSQLKQSANLFVIAGDCWVLGKSG